MWVAADELVAESFENISKRERSSLLAEQYLKRKMQKEIANLFFQFDFVMLVDGVNQFIALLEKQMGKRFRSLLPVPGALLSQDCYKTQYPFELFLQSSLFCGDYIGF